MAKPPKPVPGGTSPDTSYTNRSPSPGAPEGHALHIEHSALRLPGHDQTPAHAVQVWPGAISRQPSVLVSEIPSAGFLTTEAFHDSVTWPADRVHLLRPLGADSGLFSSSDGKVYAHVENEGHILVERQYDGRYQVPFKLTPQWPGPFLNKSERQPIWRFERPDWMPQDSEADPPRVAIVDPLTAEAPMYLDPADAARLSAALNSPDGIRYDKHRKTYVDTLDGTVMVRKNAVGEYQQAFAGVSESPDVYFERIPKTRLWRRKTVETTPLPEGLRRPPTGSEEPAPGPSKRAHPRESASHAQTLSESLLAANPEALNLSFGLWRNWGKTLQPAVGQHIEIDGLHFRIVPQALNDDSRLAYLQHPLFSPALYDAFEYMLRDNPSLQPKWAVKRNDRWLVLEGRFPFEMPITQYVSRTFRHLSDASVGSLARAMFNNANRSEVISGHGLSVLNQTFRYWVDRPAVAPPRRELADPLLILRDLVRDQGRDRDTWLTMPMSLGEGLQRLDLDPGRFPHYWNEYAADPALPNLRKLFSNVLEDDGYVIHAAPDPSGKEMLLFYRETLDAVFVLNQSPIINGMLKRSNMPVSRPDDGLWQIRIGSEQQTLGSWRNSKNIIYLLGGVQTDSLGQTTLFMVREG